MPLTLYNRNQTKRPFGEILWSPTFNIVKKGKESVIKKEHWFKRTLKTIWKFLNMKIWQ